ncbi:flagellar hook protein FlgE [Megalodesulfovibrio gigas]|uniref:Flagellar hook protein FlgE n=1 Tax=Megalodesulfovibrio gigas (strain ATCC 19364 / DSM 1382 / NCIMB 9332 / VKM B-1759) TaxID=1121448 RepID=T2G789_MEGG1|nr:flagellar hook-basal body complex protein [Megalodesulfovibrio gigas]AGW12049.1 putative flagellar hook-basal body protein [Megalodesulfovibrio gigas DSM 1382 = ATCC 19364]
MSLTSSLWTGVSGMLTHGERMTVVGNNISNVNTVGFKSSHMHFADFMSQDYVTSGSTPAQIGRGTKVSAIYGDFAQGSFETTNESTDLAISGNGFFGVSPLGSDERYYTRAGNFRFDKNGYLKDPNGYVLQGWGLTTRTLDSSSTSQNSDSLTQVTRTGSITNIKLDAGGVADPQHTSNVSLITQLDLDGGDNTSDPANPYFSLLNAWDGSQETPLSSMQYAYQTTLKVYDEAGSPHTLTVYYDQVSNAEGKNAWEYIVTMDPSEDKRFFGGTATADNTVAGTSAAGLLMAGTLTFNSYGQIESMSAYTLQADANNTDGFKNLDYWRPTSISDNGYPQFAANFTGLGNASSVVNADGTPIDPPLANASGKLIELNVGLQASNTRTWVDPLATAGGSSRASDMGNTHTTADLPSFGTNATRHSSASTSFDSASSDLYQSQDGYTFGYLQNVLVTSEGVIQGNFSNGVTLDLYQLALFDFNNKTGLRREGGNLFSETREAPLTSSQPAGTGSMGSISSGSLELSNVDLAEEFVDMITTQRGFSANGKVITTTDSMLAEVIMLKR